MEIVGQCGGYEGGAGQGESWRSSTNEKLNKKNI